MSDEKSADAPAPNRVVIKPTIGRVVWYHPNEHDPLNFSDQPLSAQIAYVHSDTLVNLGVIDKNGQIHGRLNVLLLQDGDKPEDLPLSFGVRPVYCEWMPFQKGQALKYNAPTPEQIAAEKAAVAADPAAGAQGSQAAK